MSDWHVTRTTDKAGAMFHKLSMKGGPLCQHIMTRSERLLEGRCFSLPMRVLREAQSLSNASTASMPMEYGFDACAIGAMSTA